jgi:hypothetical protein
MKKIFVSSLCIFSLLLFNSCSKDTVIKSDAEKNRLLNSFAKSIVSTSAFLKQNYSHEKLGSTNFFKNYSTKNASSQFVIETSDVDLLDAQANAHFDSLLQFSTNLLEYEGIYDSLVTEFGNDHPSLIITSAMAVYAGSNNLNTTIDGIAPIGPGLDMHEVGNCMLRAIGFTTAGIGAQIWGAANLTVKGIVGFVAKFASRFLGPFAVAWALLDLADCLYMESKD